MAKYEQGPLIGGLKRVWGGFQWCKMELRWQLIADRKSYMGFWLQQKSMIMNDLERQFTDV